MLLCAGMSAVIGALHMISCEMRVHLRGGDVRVSKQFLDRSEISSAAQHMGRETVPKSMGSDPTSQLRVLSVPFEYLPKPLACKTFTTSIDEQAFFSAVLAQRRAPIAQVLVDGVDCPLMNGYDSLLVPLPETPYISVVHNIIDVQRDQLADSHATGIQEFKHGAVTFGLRRILTCRLLKKLADLVDRNWLGERTSNVRCPNIFGGTRPELTFFHHESKERLRRRDLPSLGSSGIATIFQMQEIAKSVLLAEVWPRRNYTALVDLPLGKLQEIVLEVVTISKQCVIGKPLFHREVSQESFDIVFHGYSSFAVVRGRSELARFYYVRYVQSNVVCAKLAPARSGRLRGANHTETHSGRQNTSKHAKKGSRSGPNHLRFELVFLIVSDRRLCVISWRSGLPLNSEVAPPTLSLKFVP